MEQGVLAERTEGLGGPAHKTGWMDAHVQVHNGYPLVSVRYSRTDSSGRSSADWSGEAILPVSGYAAALVHAIAAEGKSPRRMMVEAVADPPRQGEAVEIPTECVSSSHYAPLLRRSSQFRSAGH